MDVTPTTPTHLDAEPLPAEESAGLSADERSAEEAQARRLAERYRLEFLDMDAVPDRPGAVPVDSRGPDAALRLRAVSAATARRS